MSKKDIDSKSISAKNCDNMAVPREKSCVLFDKRIGKDNQKEVISNGNIFIAPAKSSTQDIVTHSSLPLRKWLTMKQAAVYLGLTVRGLEGYVRRGQIRGYKPFGRVLFDMKELDCLIAASRK